MLTAAAPELLHVVGYLTGATLYAMLLVMVIRAKPADLLMVVTAGAGLAWNVGELLVQGVRRAESFAAATWLEAASYAALGTLAAVVVHSVTREPGQPESTLPQHVRRAIPAAAYGVAALAALLHFLAAAAGAIVPSRAALILLTSGLVLLAPALVLTTMRQANGRRAFWMTALTVFAVSALHLGSPHADRQSWPLELVGHHASIPLAFAILYEDYRFALADLFLKQALTLIALVTLVFAAWSMAIPPGASASEVQGVLLALWVGTALLFPWLRSGVTAFVDRFVLRRANYATLLERFAATLQQCDTEEDLLARACELLAPALSATTVTWEPHERVGATSLQPQEVAVHTTDMPRYVLAVGRLAGGRRLLSDDIAMLDRVAALATRRIDALRLTNERYERVMHEQEMQALATDAELRALRSQINPHFLFNALTTIGYLIQQAPARALDTLMRLTTLLRGVLRSEGEFTTLRHERELIECYLEIERERFEERLRVAIAIPDELLDVGIPALIVQPLVENAIKHGIAASRAGGSVAVSASTTRGIRGPALRIAVRNTGAPMRGRTPGEDGGVGLRSIERRLECYYREGARLELTTDADGATVAELTLPLPAAVDERVPLVRRAGR